MPRLSDRPPAQPRAPSAGNLCWVVGCTASSSSTCEASTSLLVRPAERTSASARLGRVAAPLRTASTLVALGATPAGVPGGILAGAHHQHRRWTRCRHLSRCGNDERSWLDTDAKRLPSAALGVGGRGACARHLNAANEKAKSHKRGGSRCARDTLTARGRDRPLDRDRTFLSDRLSVGLPVHSYSCWQRGQHRSGPPRSIPA